MKMKKHITYLCSIVTLLSGVCSGCGSNENASTQDSSTTPSQESTTPSHPLPEPAGQLKALGNEWVETFKVFDPNKGFESQMNRKQAIWQYVIKKADGKTATDAYRRAMKDAAANHGKDMALGRFSLTDAQGDELFAKCALPAGLALDGLVALTEIRMPFEASDATTEVFTVDFANDQLGGGYKRDACFVQEEIMFVECPHLPVLYFHESKGHLRAQDLQLGSRATILITSVPRYGTVKKNLYGQGALETKTQPADVFEQKPSTTPTKHNILALAARKLTGGPRSYTPQDFKDLFVPAYVGFRAAKKNAQGKKVKIETGNWGAGVFNHNVCPSALAQLVAAALAGVEQLAAYTYDAAGQQGWQAAKQLLQATCAALRKANQPLTPKNIFAHVQKEKNLQCK